jgi:hypothetical protein
MAGCTTVVPVHMRKGAICSPVVYSKAHNTHTHTHTRARARAPAAPPHHARTHARYASTDAHAKVHECSTTLSSRVRGCARIPQGLLGRTRGCTCVCFCVCVWVWELVRIHVRVCVCARARVSVYFCVCALAYTLTWWCAHMR